MHKIKKKNFSCIKMFNINADTYAENCVHTINVIKKDNKSISWIKTHDIQVKLGVKSN